MQKQISETIKNKWNFRELRNKNARHLMAAYDHYYNDTITVGLINGSFDEILKKIQDDYNNRHSDDQSYNPIQTSFDFKDSEKFFYLNETEFDYNLIRRFVKSFKCVIMLGKGKPLVIEYKPNWTIIIAPRVTFN